MVEILVTMCHKDAPQWTVSRRTRRRTVVFTGTALCLFACQEPQALVVVPSGQLMTHFLPDYEYLVDSTTGFATSNHLVVFNPGAQTATVTATVLFEDRDPAAFTLSVPPMTSTETNQSRWPVQPNTRFGVVLESDAPVIAQATIGWTNTLNDYRPTARAADGGPPRETALSYIAHDAPATRWLVADGIVIASPTLFIRESEWAVLLNPGDDTAHVNVSVAVGTMQRVAQVAVPPRRVRSIRMDELVPRNTHYGAVISSDAPIVANWRRTVQWPDRPDLMAFWSVPMVGLQIFEASNPTGKP